MDMEIVFGGGKRVNALYKGFTIKTDQPPDLGGDGSAPSPFDLFLTSIGACAGFYVFSFCQERGISTEGIQLIQRMERDPQAKMVRKIEIEIHLPEKFPEKYRGAVVKAAELCTVKKHLDDPPTITVCTTGKKAK
jgi:ribosomal protein S12 methylthiotransferase accessory factor